jgi:CubicO group peptidase (beta-lactamase class C family)
MKKLIFILSALLGANLSFGQTGNGDPRFANMEVYADSVLNLFHIAGFAVAVVENDKVIYAKGFGYRDYENKVPVTPNTVFPIGSCSKAFTAALCGMLADEGKLDFDQPIRNYLPELRFYDDYTTAHATAKDLMTHRTGVPRHDAVYDFFDKSLSRDSLIYRIRYLKPFAELRQHYSYNNLMYTTLGVLCEHITKQSYEQNIQEKILNPLGMTSTSITPEDLLANADHSLGYANQNGVIIQGEYGTDNLEAPAGGINSSVADMSKWLIAWLNNGLYKGKQVLPRSYVDQAMRAQMVIDNGPAYGFGWNILAFRGGHYKVEHSGSVRLANSTVCFYPPAVGNNSDNRFGIVVLANEFGDYATSLIRDYLSDILLNSGRTDLPGKIGYWPAWFAGYKKYYANNHPAAKAPVKKVEPLPLTHPLTAYTGKYHDPGYGTIEVYVKNDSLAARFNKVDLKLTQVNYDIFNAEPGGMLKFNMDNSGTITNITMPLEENVSDIIFKRIK